MRQFYLMIEDSGWTKASETSRAKRETWFSCWIALTNLFRLSLEHCCLIGNTHLQQIIVWIKTLGNCKFEFLWTKPIRISANWYFPAIPHDRISTIFQKEKVVHLWRRYPLGVLGNLCISAKPIWAYEQSILKFIRGLLEGKKINQALDKCNKF
jgi:hypothetical protein